MGRCRLLAEELEYAPVSDFALVLFEPDLVRPAFARRSVNSNDKSLAGLRAGGKPVCTFRDHALNRHAHARPQTPEWTVAERDIAAMRARDVAGDGQT